MRGETRSSRYRWLWLWCGILTLAVVAMAVVLISSQLSSTTKDCSSAHIPENDTTLASTPRSPEHFIQGPPVSYIQLTLNDRTRLWQTDGDVVGADETHSLILQDNSIHCKKDGVYFVYAYVTFHKMREEHQNKQKRIVTLYGNGIDKSEKRLFEGVYSGEGEGSVSMAKMVRLVVDDSLKLSISTNMSRGDPVNTYWGAYQI